MKLICKVIFSVKLRTVFSLNLKTLFYSLLLFHIFTVLNGVESSYSFSFQFRSNTEIFLSFLMPAYVTHAKVNSFNKQNLLTLL